MLKYPTNQDTEQYKKQAHAIARGLFLMGQMGETKPAIEWLAEEAKRLAIEACGISDYQAMLRVQGGVQVIGQIMDKIKHAREVAEGLE